MASTQTRFIDFVTATPSISPTALARQLGLNRSYLYELAGKCGYSRVGGEWVTQGDVEQRGDIQFQTILEMRDMLERLVSGDVVTTSDGVSHPPATSDAPELQPWQVVDIGGVRHWVIPTFNDLSRDQRNKYTSMPKNVLGNGAPQLWQGPETIAKRLAMEIVTTALYRIEHPGEN